MSNFIFPSRTIQHPGFEFTESDLLTFKECSDERNGLFIGFSSQGPIGEPVLISSEQEFINIFGIPQNFGEFYLYKGVESILNISKENANAIVIRLPYNNNIFNAETFTQKHKALKYTIKTSNTGLGDYKQLFENEPSFKNVSSEMIYVNENELEEFEKLNTSDFIIYNKRNSQVNDGEELLISVLGRSNALSAQGFLAKAPVDIFDYEQFNVVNDNTVGRKNWAYDVVDSINSNLLKWVPEIKTILVKDSNTGFYNKFIQQENNKNNITVIVSKIKRSSIEQGKYTLEILEIFTGSLFKGDIDPISRETCYIGDFINEESQYIGFAGHSSYKNFKRDVDELFVHDLSPLRISLNSEEDTLKKIFDIDTNINILKRSLNKLSDFDFSDIFDCGTSDIVSSLDQNGFYNPNDTRIQINVECWQKWTNAIGHFCKYGYPYCTAFLDLPKALLLRGQLSKLHELYEDEDKVINPEIIQQLAIQDNCYTTSNCEWVKLSNQFLKVQQYVPSSCLMSGVVNELNEFFNPPAGCNKYGVIKESLSDIALIPNFETADLLYKNHINYISFDYQKGIAFFDGQKTNWNTDYQLNRINVRRLVNYLKRYTIGIAKQYIGEVNNVATRESFKSDLEKEFERVTLLGGLDSYSIDVGTDINSQLVVNDRELRVKIIIKPISCIEFVLANFSIIND